MTLLDKPHQVSLIPLETVSGANQKLPAIHEFLAKVRVHVISDAVSLYSEGRDDTHRPAEIYPFKFSEFAVYRVDLVRAPAPARRRFDMAGNM